METVRCPACREELSRIEKLEGRCVNCGVEFEPAASASHGELEESPYKPSENIREPLTRRQGIAILLFTAFLVTLFTPLGLIYSCYVALQKGDSLCAYSGCTRDAVAQVEYSGGVKRGYCEEHAKNHPASISNKELIFPVALCVLAAFFLAFVVAGFTEAFRGKIKPPARPGGKPRDPLRSFLILAVVAIVGVNALFWFMARYMC